MKKFITVLCSFISNSGYLLKKTPKGVLYDAKILPGKRWRYCSYAAPYLPAPLKPELAVRILG